MVEKETSCLLPLRDMVVFPGMIVPIFIGRGKSIATVEEAMRRDRRIVLVAQRAANVADPGADDLFPVGVRANIIQMIRLQDNTIKLLVEATSKVRLLGLDISRPYLSAEVEDVPEILDWKGSREIEYLAKSIASEFVRYIKLNKDIAIDSMAGIEKIDNPVILIDTAIMGLSAKVEKKQEILEEDTLRGKLEKLYALIGAEMEFMKLDRKIRSRVKQAIDRNQKEFYLNEQMHAIQKELGEDDDGELRALEGKIESAGMSKEALVKAKSELKKLKKMSPQSPEAAVLRNYIDCLVELPWARRSELNADIGAAEKILNDEHYALDKVKERILEFLAVQRRVGSAKGSILCFMGPPGVGKTSLGRAIAKATGRVFQKLSLGGVHDEAEIRGHRRTYIGSQTGKILSTMKKAGVINPLVMLDELDKLGADTYHGDPSSALLEVLDPEQNHGFNDHYLDLDYDLSNVMFIATANTYDIPRPLLDRMEIIELSGYTEEEKLEIAKRHIMPKELAKNGLSKDEFSMTDDAVRDLIRYYTRESGVRGLERYIDRVMRKSLRRLPGGNSAAPGLFRLDGEKPDKEAAIRITSKNLSEFAGVRKFDFGRAEKKDAVGMVTGLAWTEVGGEILTIESAAMAGKGLAVFTGKLGDVMKESIETAKSFVRSRSLAFGINPKIWGKVDIHIHVPEGATPKDGPSAGIAMMTSIVSTLAEIPVRKDVAMTGEITLRGRVLPIGGLKEKLLAALRGGIKTAIIPFENKKDLEEIPRIVKDGLEIIPVKSADEVLKIALARPLSPIAETGNFFENLLAQPAEPVQPVVQ